MAFLDFSRRGVVALPFALTAASWTARVMGAEAQSLGIDAAACKKAGVDPGALAPVETFFNGMIGEAQHPGAELAIVKKDNLLAYFAAGHDGDGKPILAPSLFCILSNSKLLGTMVMCHLHDQGVFNFDDKIAKHWPEFAANGKQDITIEQVMSHRAGLVTSLYGDFADWREWDKPDGLEKLLIAMTPQWPPGTANGYHSVTFGHVIEVLVRRWTGHTTGEILRAQITEPLGIKDVYLGITDAEYTRYAKLPTSRFGIMPGAPPGGETSFFNSLYILKQSLPWGGGVATAADLSLLMGVYAGEGTLRGKKIFSREIFDLISTPTNKPEDVDRIIKRRIRWGTGVAVGTTEGVGQIQGPVFGAKASPRTVGHLGGSASYTWADPDNEVSMTFLSTSAPMFPKYSPLSDAVRDAVGT